MVDAGPDQVADEGAVVSFAGAFSDPDAGDTHTVAWDFGDGSSPLVGGSEGGLTPTHVYADDGVYTVTLTVTDDEGAVGSDTLVVTVRNVAPTVDVGPDQTADAGEVVYFSGVFTDPGTLDAHTIAWDFGDEATVSGTLTPMHTYANSGTYTVTLTVTDDDGGVGSDSARIRVQPIFKKLAIEHATIHWWEYQGDRAAFTLIGRIELPDGYTSAGLSRDLTLSLRIGAGSVSQTISLRQIGRGLWCFHRESGPPAAGLDLRQAIVVWYGRGAGRSAQFVLQGTFTMPGVNAGTRPAEATVGLQLPLAEDRVPWISNERHLVFHTYHHLWWYHAR